MLLVLSRPDLRVRAELAHYLRLPFTKNFILFVFLEYLPDTCRIKYLQRIRYVEATEKGRDVS